MRAEAIIKLDYFKENINSVRERIGQERLICVPVKADAYGHGALKIAKASLESGANCLGVASVQEGKELRKGGIKAPILIFSQSSPDETEEIIESDLIPFVSDMEFASILDKQAKINKKKASVHLKIDTGMGRIGCSAEESLIFARHIASCTGLKMKGIATHLAVSDSAGRQDIDYTKNQLSSFKKAVDAIRKDGIDPGIVHAANSGAVILHPDAWLDMVRPGILLYGYKAAEEYEAPLDHLKKLSKYKSITVKPVMELRCSVSLIKKIKKGGFVSYGRTWTADKDTFIAILSAGYADGLPRMAGSKWQVCINNRFFPVIGRISMDQCCVDLQTDDMNSLPEISRWDKAVIFGSQTETDSGRRGAAALAEAAGTIPYEITCNVSKRVPRVYSDNHLATKS